MFIVVGRRDRRARTPRVDRVAGATRPGRSALWVATVPWPGRLDRGSSVPACGSGVSSSVVGGRSLHIGSDLNAGGHRGERPRRQGFHDHDSAPNGPVGPRRVRCAPTARRTAHDRGAVAGQGVRGGAAARPGGRGSAGLGVGTELDRSRAGRALVLVSGLASPSGSTAISPTGAFAAVRVCGSAWPSRAAWRSKARSSAGSPTIGATTLSPTRTATRTRRGCSVPARLALAKGFVHAHVGWLFERDRTNAARFTPDLIADPDISRVDRQFLAWSVVSLAVPAVLGGLITWSWWGAADRAFLGRAGPDRAVAPRHLVDQLDLPYDRQEAIHRAGPLHELLAVGDPVDGRVLAQLAPRRSDQCASRRVPGQLDMSARLIAIFEKLGWAYDIRWPTPRRLARLIDRQQREPADAGDPAGEPAAPPAGGPTAGGGSIDR